MSLIWWILLVNLLRQENLVNLIENRCSKSRQEFEVTLKTLTGILTWNYFIEQNIKVRQNFFRLIYEDYFIIFDNKYTINQNILSQVITYNKYKNVIPKFEGISHFLHCYIENEKIIMVFKNVVPNSFDLTQEYLVKQDMHKLFDKIKIQKII